MICTSFVESSGNMTGESSDWKLEENVKKKIQSIKMLKYLPHARSCEAFASMI